MAHNQSWESWKCDRNWIVEWRKRRNKSFLSVGKTDANFHNIGEMKTYGILSDSMGIRLQLDSYWCMTIPMTWGQFPDAFYDLSFPCSHRGGLMSF